MHRNASDVVGVGLKYVDSLEGVVVEDTDLHVVGASDYPIFTCDKFACAHWRLAYLERFHQLLFNIKKNFIFFYLTFYVIVIYLCLMIPNMHISIVQADKHPRLSGMNVHRFDAVRSGRKLAFYFQLERLCVKTTKQLNVTINFNTRPSLTILLI